jgi:hypothetical protein
VTFAGTVRLAAVGAPASYTNEILADSPLFFVQLNETAGTTAEDSSPNNNDLTYSSVLLAQTSTIAGLSGDACTLNQPADTISRDAGIGASATSWTLEIWYKDFYNLSTTNAAMYSFHASGVLGTYLISLGTGEVRFGVNNTSNSYQQIDSSGGSGILDGDWHHIVGRFDGSDNSFDLFIDGAYKNGGTVSGTARVPASGGAITIGDAPQIGSTLVGAFAAGAFYDSALSDARILAHYNAGTSA